MDGPGNSDFIRTRMRRRKLILFPILLKTCQSFPFSLQSSSHVKRSRPLISEACSSVRFEEKCNFSMVLNHHSNKRKSALYNKSSNVQEWKAGDWESDLQALESAVALSNAPTDLAQTERLELLDEFARQRRDLIPDVGKYVVRPCAYAAALLLASKSSSKTSRKLVSGLIQSMNLCFWAFTVWIPLALHHLAMKPRKIEKRRKSEWEAEYINPEEDCRDYARCLLENWAYTIYPSALLFCFSLLSQVFNIYGPKKVRLSFGDEQNLIVWRVATAFLILMTRLGAAASIQQFPIYLYQLRKDLQKGPVPWFQYVLSILIRSSMFFLPLGFATDLTQLNELGLKIGLKNALIDFFRGKRIITIILPLVFVPSILMQLCQLIAFKKLFRVGYFTKVSLAMSSTKLQALLKNPGTNDDVFQIKLRYRLHWREPKRLFSSCRMAAQDFTLFLFRGWGDEASILEESKMEPHILQLIKKEMEEKSQSGNLCSNRESWIPLATKRMKEIHQENYKTNSFEDPLGIALQQTFGIGLSFDFDHDTKLIEEESPSVHKLRARAAKSAIKRFHDIPDIVRRELKNEQQYRCDGDDLKDTFTKAAEIRIEEERKRLKHSVVRLLSLIPSNAPAPGGKSLDVLAMRKSDITSVYAASKLNLPFIPDHDERDDSSNQIDGSNDLIVKDGYSGDDIFRNGGKNNLFA